MTRNNKIKITYDDLKNSNIDEAIARELYVRKRNEVNSKLIDKKEAKNIDVINQKESTLSQILLPIAGFLLTLILFVSVSLSLNPNSLIYRLFLPAGFSYQKAVPFLIVFLSLWSFLQLVIKLIVIRKEKIIFNENFVLDLPDYLQKQDIKTTFKEFVSYTKNREGNFIRRISMLLQRLDTTNDIQRSHEFLKHQSEIDSEIAASGYTTVRIFIWAMPILGFIGTVIGISLAVGEFSGFLKKGGGDMAIGEIREQLSNVATGLSFAFDTTLLGLIASLITMLFTSFTQKMEEGFLNNVESLCLKIIYHFKPMNTRITNDDPVNTSIEPIQKELKEVVNAMHNISQNLAKMLENSDAIDKKRQK